MSPVLDNLPYMLSGLKLTFLVAICSLVASSMLAIIFGVGRTSAVKSVHYVSVAFIELGRAVPAMLLVLFTYFVVVQAGVNISPIAAAIIALSVDSGAYGAEIVRSGIQAVSTGQMEASRASGLSYFKAMRLVVLPQALRTMVPALTSEGTKIIKNTSLVAIIGGADFFNRVNIVNGRLLVHPFALFGFAALVYFVINYSFSLSTTRLQWRRDV